MKFLSIDSSLRHTGVALGDIAVTGINTIEIIVDTIMLNSTEKDDTKKIRASSDLISRCKKTHDFIHELIATEKPQVVFVETPSGSKSSAAMKSYGVTCALIASIYPDPIQLTPNDVKMASIGKKTASKAEIIKWAMDKYPHLPWDINQSGVHKGEPKAKNEHTADAVAIVHAGVKTPDFKRLMQLINGRDH